MTVEERQNELVSEVARLRQEQGLTQKQLGQLSGVKQPVIARIETGVNTPQLATVIKLLEPLGKTLAVVPLESK
ncbi:MAG: helix-turn-helix domain-containing protein [Christensenellales bacterium]|jgi:predicted transcriptional regulator